MLTGYYAYRRHEIIIEFEDGAPPFGTVFGDVVNDVKIIFGRTRKQLPSSSSALDTVPTGFGRGSCRDGFCSARLFAR